MSAPRPTGVRPSADPRTATLTVRVGGELDDACGAELTAVVVAHLTGPAPPRAVRLDFRDLTGVDRLGLAALLMVGRHSSAARAVLHLDHRPPFLERLLRQTDVLGHLTSAGTGAE
ncbi:STAS domain-containing protein [Streptomyces sp. NRRL S-37]|uniref:STAS domain-containing protein n=1 Tax=Streptomyces sp. NRRL S-37 TaxID=1463903 RepID=UPI0004CC8731|nr:STAS domain-containing protein [Streptomyces sp. NRRL S-37]